MVVPSPQSIVQVLQPELEMLAVTTWPSQPGDGRLILRFGDAPTEMLVLSVAVPQFPPLQVAVIVKVPVEV